MRRSTTLAVLIASLALSACAKRPPAKTPVADAATTEMEGRNRAAELEAEERARRAAEEARRAEEDRQRAALYGDMIFFEFDSFELTPESRSVLDRKLTALRNASSLRLRIDGHADDQGSDEYNLALGQRRANAAMEYLLSYGADPMRVSITSFGEERPLVSGQGEEARAQNRRAEFADGGR